MIDDLLAWEREHGDRTVADVSAFLATPYPAVRQTPIPLLLRMHEQAARIAKIRRS